MATINKVILIGRCGADPVSHCTAEGQTITKMRLATSEKYTDKKTGENKENVEWHSVVFFGRLAEVAHAYCRKGSLNYIEGKIKTSKWVDDGQQERYGFEIMGTHLQMLSSRSLKEEPNLVVDTAMPITGVSLATNNYAAAKAGADYTIPF